jgi:hypothetical protein
VSIDDEEWRVLARPSLGWFTRAPIVPAYVDEEVSFRDRDEMWAPPYMVPPGWNWRSPPQRIYLQEEIPFTFVAGFGTAGVATFVLVLEPGTKTSYAWHTNIFKTYSGNEQRISTSGARPARRVEGVASLLDGSARDVRGALMRYAASGAVFALALPFEELVFSADSAGGFVFVDSTASSDWVRATQRVAVIGADGSSLLAVIQTVTATTIRLNVAPGVTGRAGGRIMPTVQFLIDPQVGFARYPVAVDLWSIRGTIAEFGWLGLDRMGLGAQVSTYTVGGPIDVALLVESDVLIWDRPNYVSTTSNEAMLSFAETLDFGGVPQGIGGALVPDWVKPVRYTSSDPADWQWLKAFLRVVRGRQKSWLLSTNHDDLLLVSTTVNGIKVSGPTVAGSGDYAAWFASLAHRRLALTMGDGTTQYYAVTAVIDNGNGTLNLNLDSSVIGTVVRVSILEQVRFDNNDSDEFPVTWDGGTFSIDWTARATQETLVPPTLFVYNAFSDIQLTYSPPPPPPTDQELIPTTVNKIMYVKLTSDRSLTFGGIAVPGGNVDGMVITVMSSNNNAFSFNFLHEDTMWSSGDRMWNANSATIFGTNHCVTYVYNGTVGRWIQTA